MDNFDIDYEQHGKYSAVVYSVSYINPIEDIQSISTELKEHLPAGGHILFDSLLSNGDNFNRFAEVFFDGEDINATSIHVVDRVAEISSDELEQLNRHYRGKVEELNNSVLSVKDRSKFTAIEDYDPKYDSLEDAVNDLQASELNMTQ